MPSTKRNGSLRIDSSSKTLFKQQAKLSKENFGRFLRLCKVIDSLETGVSTIETSLAKINEIKYFEDLKSRCNREANTYFNLALDTVEWAANTTFDEKERLRLFTKIIICKTYPISML